MFFSRNAGSTSPIHHSIGKLSTPWAVLSLAYQSIGVIYGDIGTSPLYVFSSIFASKTPNKEDVLGATSLIFWTITLIVLVEYVLVVLRADDNGQGGTFALYSLICRKANINVHGNTAAEDQRISTYSRSLASSSRTFVTGTPSVGEVIVRILRRKRWTRHLLTFLVLFTASMVLGDGVLTPAISGAVIGISCTIIVVLFVAQRFGTARIGRSFAPVVLIWFASNVGVALYNISKYDSAIFRAVSPHYAALFFHRRGKEGFLQLGGVFLCITGAEAMYADLGHFAALPIQLSFSTVVYPSLILTYLGQAAWLTHHLDDVSNTFYGSIPTPIFWPMLVIATLAAIVASQAVISAAFSLFSQSIALGYFPRLSIIHTSTAIEGQIYIPEVCWTMMFLTVAVVAGFQDTTRLGNAYGIAVNLVMLSTVLLMSVVMLVVWDINVPMTLAFGGTFGTILLIFLATLIRHVPEGGWFALTVGVFITFITGTWYVGTATKSDYLSKSKCSMEDLVTVEADQVEADGMPAVVSRFTGRPLTRVPGMALLYAEHVHGPPLVFVELVKRLGVMHEVAVFVTVRSVAVPTIPETERLVFEQLDLPGAFRCIARYGYMERIDHGPAFVALILTHIKAYVTPSVLTVASAGDSPEGPFDPEQPALGRPTSLPVLELQTLSKPPLLTSSASAVKTSHLVMDITAPVETAADGKGAAGISPSVLPGPLGLDLEQGVQGVSQESAFPEIAIRVPGMGVMVQGAVNVGEQAVRLMHPVQYIFVSPTLSAAEHDSFVKRVLLDHVYSIIKKNAQKPHQRWRIPLEGLVEIGIVMKV